VTTLDTVSASKVRTGAPHQRMPLARIATTELRKMFDTRSGFWLLASIGILALLATAAVILFASDDQLTYATFTSAVNIPVTVILPVIAILSVTCEWSQRTGLTTFTLVPHRGRVIAAKAMASVGVAVVTVPLAFGISALGNLVGTGIAGIEPVWDLTVLNLVTIVLANVLSVLFGFMLGVVIRNSVGALVAYFVYQFLLPTLSLILAASHHWFRDLQPWVDFDYAQSALFNGAVTTQQWTHLAFTGTVWLVIPMTIGLTLVRNAEVK
jgi:ABC-2 type transport system permease protein